MDEIMTVREIALYLQVHPMTIYHLLKRKNLPSFKVGNAWRLSLQDVEKWMEENSRLDKS